jgi:hypothetical protein
LAKYLWTSDHNNNNISFNPLDETLKNVGKTPRPNHRVFIGVTWKESGRIRVIAMGVGVPESRFIIAII